MRPRKSKFWALFALLLPLPLIAAQFTLSWQDNSSNEEGWRVERATGTGPFITLVEFPTTTKTQSGESVRVSYVDANLPPSTTFRYRVFAYNTGGDSGASNIATGLTPPLVEPPDGPGETLNLTEPGRLTNLSNRGLVGVGSDEPAIAGFVIEGGSATILLRAAGPALAVHGVTGFVPDPIIQLIGGASNDDWVAANTAAASTQVGAFPFAAGSKDAALLVRLPAGQYTAHVTGKGAAGIVLVEVYLVPEVSTP